MNGRPTTIEAALVELLARAKADALGAELHLELVQHGMQAQADHSTNWIPQWGDLIELAGARIRFRLQG